MPTNIICPNCQTPIDKVKRKIEKPNILIVEGRDEEGFFEAFIKKFGLQNLQVMGIGGKTLIQENLKGLVIDQAFQKIRAMGIIRDSDEDPANAFISVQGALKAAGLPVPKETGKFEAGPPKIGIMLFPSADRKGALEDLCLDSISADPAYSCMEQYFDCLKDRGLHIPEKEVNKARVRVFLSSREDPTVPLGIGAQKDYWPLDHRVFQPVITFLKELVK